MELFGHDPGSPHPQPELFELLLEEEPGGARPDRLCEVRPQDRDLRRTVDQIVGAVPGLPALDVPVPQMVDQPLTFLAAFDFLVPEQVIKVPKIPTSSRFPRTVLSVPQTAEKLVEAPTIVSLIEIIWQPVEQTVGGGGGEGLPGFLPGQSCSLSAEQLVDSPVPSSWSCWRSSRFAPRTEFHSVHRVPAATAEQIVDITVLRGAPHDVHQDPLPAAGSCD